MPGTAIIHASGQSDRDKMWLFEQLCGDTECVSRIFSI